MRKPAYLVAMAFLLFAIGATAQTSSTGNKQTTTTTTTTTQQTTTTGAERSVEGCLLKEASDYFLIPAHGNPIELQATSGQDLSAHEGHKVKVSGVESTLSASSSGTGMTGGATGVATSTSTTATGAQSSTHSVGENAGSSAAGISSASGTGSDLHKLATKQMAVSNLQHEATSCPVNWNPGVKRSSSK
jgi:hypothetical protein